MKLDGDHGGGEFQSWDAQGLERRNSRFSHDEAHFHVVVLAHSGIHPCSVSVLAGVAECMQLNLGLVDVRRWSDAALYSQASQLGDSGQPLLDVSKQVSWYGVVPLKLPTAKFLLGDLGDEHYRTDETEWVVET